MPTTDMDDGQSSAGKDTWRFFDFRNILHFWRQVENQNRPNTAGRILSLLGGDWYERQPRVLTPPRELSPRRLSPPSFLSSIHPALLSPPLPSPSHSPGTSVESPRKSKKGSKKKKKAAAAWDDLDGNDVIVAGRDAEGNDNEVVLFDGQQGEATLSPSDAIARDTSREPRLPVERRNVWHAGDVVLYANNVFLAERGSVRLPDPHGPGQGAEHGHLETNVDGIYHVAAQDMIVRKRQKGRQEMSYCRGNLWPAVEGSTSPRLLAKDLAKSSSSKLLALTFSLEDFAKNSSPELLALTVSPEDFAKNSTPADLAPNSISGDYAQSFPAEVLAQNSPTKYSAQQSCSRLSDQTSLRHQGLSFPLHESPPISPLRLSQDFPKLTPYAPQWLPPNPCPPINRDISPQKRCDTPDWPWQTPPVSSPRRLLYKIPASEDMHKVHITLTNGMPLKVRWPHGLWLLLAAVCVSYVFVSVAVMHLRRLTFFPFMRQSAPDSTYGCLDPPPPPPYEGDVADDSAEPCGLGCLKYLFE